MSLASAPPDVSLPAPALPGGLRALAEELPPGRLSRALERLSARLEAGQSWEAALEERDLGLPPHVRGLLRAAVAGARLGDSLEQFVQVHRLGRQLRREIWLVLAYPLALLSMLVLLLACFELYFIAPLADLFTGFAMRPIWSTVATDSLWDMALPPSTRLVVVMSQWHVSAGLAACGALAALALAAHRVRPWWLMDRLLDALPLVGPLWYWTALVEFTRLLGLLLEVGIPLPRALELAAAGQHDAAVAWASRKLAGPVAEGRSLAAALEASTDFPPTLVPIVRWGEQHSALPEALRTAGEMFEGRVRVQMNLLRTFFPPATFLFVAGVVLLLAHAAMAPIMLLVRFL